MKKAICQLLAALLCVLCAAAHAERLVLPGELTVIKERAFYGAEAVTEAVLPEGVAEIGEEAFAQSGLKRIHLPASLISIAENAFDGCEGLKAFAQEGTYAYAFCIDNGIRIAGTALLERVAMVTDCGTIDDASFNQACWEGVKAFAGVEGLTYQYYQPAQDSDDERLAAMDAAVSDGADAIVLPGYLHGAALSAAQEMYPEVRFIGIDITVADVGADLLENTFCITFREEQAGYLAGYAAVSEGFTKLGFLGGMAVPAVQRYGYGFVQGASAAADALGVKVGINFDYAGQFFGSAALTQQIDAWYAGGVDVVFACGGSIWTSVMEAATAHDRYLIGVDVDQHANGESCVSSYGYNPFITSAVKNLEEATVYALEKAHNGMWSQIGGTTGNLGLAEGDHVGLAAGSSWGFKQFSQSEYEVVKDMIREGSLKVSDSLSKPSVSSGTDVRYIHEGDEPLGEEKIEKGVRTAILTGSTAVGEEEYYAAVRARDTYGSDYVIHDTYADKYYADISGTVAKLTGFASDPDVGAIVACRAVQGVMQGFSNIKTMYAENSDRKPLLIGGMPGDDPSYASSCADLLFGSDEAAQGDTIAETIAGWGCEVFLHYSFPRHLAMETVAARKALLEANCQALGITYVEITMPDPTSRGEEVMVEFLEADLPERISSYGGKKVAVFSTACEAQPVLLTAVLADQNAYYPQPCCPSPYHGFPQALGLSISVGGSDEAALTQIAEALDREGAANRFSTWPAPVNMAIVDLSCVYAQAYMNGETDGRNDADAVSALLKEMLPGATASVYVTEYDTVIDNYYNILLRPVDFVDYL